MDNNDCTSSEIRSARGLFLHFGETVKKVAALPPPFPPRPVLAKAGAGMTADVAAGFSDDLLSLAYFNRPSEKQNRRRDFGFPRAKPTLHVV